MSTELQKFKFALYAERAHRLAFDIALQSVNMGANGNGIAVIADETRNLGNNLHGLLGDVLSDNVCVQIIENNVLQLKFLLVNGMIELSHIDNPYMERQECRRLMVIYDEIGTLTNDLMSLFDCKQTLPAIIPRVSPKSAATDITLTAMMAMRIGGIDFVENACYLDEVVSTSLLVKDNALLLRGESMPILPVFSKLSLKETMPVGAYAVVSKHSCGMSKRVVVPLDTLPTIFRSHMGVSTPYTGKLPRECVRECWNAEEDRQMIFLDYMKFCE